MAGKLLSNSFSAYELTDGEVLQGSILNTLQTQVIQNHLATYAEEKIALDFDPTNERQFLQREAELKGKIQLLQYLLDASKSSEEALTNLSTNS